MRHSGRDFVTADLHFSHDKIIVYENRPFASAEEMNETLIKNWNNAVSQNDRVFVLGDVSFCGETETRDIIRRLNGYKILILGNHDRGQSVKYWLDAGFDEVSHFPIIYREFLIMSHEPPAYFNNNTPYAYFYGHVHSTDMYRTVTHNTACLSAERWDYTPVLIDKVIKMMSSAEDA